MSFNSVLPNPDKLEIAEVYNLNSYEFEFGNQASNHNLEVLSTIQKDFADKFKINLEDVRKAFTVETIHHIRGAENLLVIFKHKDSEYIYKYFFNNRTDTFYILKDFQIKTERVVFRF